MSETAEIKRWLSATVAGEVVSWERLVSGNSRTTWSADLETAGGPVAAIVRVDSGDGPFSDTPLTLDREAVVYRALADSGVAIPRIVDFDAELHALALERVEGTPEWNDDVLDGVLAELARLHAIDAEALDLPGLARTAAGEIDLWAEIAAKRARPSPYVDLAIEVLRETFPGEPERIVMAHGDPGVGNLLWHDGRVAALLDWEMSHLGDPHDDIAFLTVRTVMHGLELPGFGERVAARYGSPGGLQLDPHRVRYWQAVAVLRNLLTCLASIANPVRGRDRLVHHMLVPSLDRLLMRCLAGLLDVELEPAPPLGDGLELPGRDVLEEVTLSLQEAADAVPAGDTRQRLKRMRVLTAQVAASHALAPVVAAADAAEGPAPGGLEDRLLRLGRMAERQTRLFPRARTLAEAELPGLEPAA